MAIRLPNGNTLGNYGTGGAIREITPDKQTVFHVKFDVADRQRLLQQDGRPQRAHRRPLRAERRRPRVKVAEAPRAAARRWRSWPRRLLERRPSPTGTAGSSGGAAGTGGAGTAAPRGGRAAGLRERGLAASAARPCGATAYDGYDGVFHDQRRGTGLRRLRRPVRPKRIAAAAARCTGCNWTHPVEHTNPTVMTDGGGACDANDGVPATRRRRAHPS